LKQVVCLKACQNFRRRVLLFELDQDVYLELLQSLLDVIEEQTNAMEEEKNDPNALVQKKYRFNLDCA
jgi:hypothetical protein